MDTMENPTMNKKQTAYRATNSHINKTVEAMRAQIKGDDKIVHAFRLYVDKKADANELLRRYLMRIDSVCEGETLSNTHEKGRTWAYTLEAYRSALQETGHDLERVSNCKLKDYKVDYKIVELVKKSASKPASAKGEKVKGLSPAAAKKQQAEQLHDLMPAATQLSASKVKALLKGVDPVSALIFAAHIIESVTGHREAFAAVLNQYTEQHGKTRTLKEEVPQLKAVSNN